MQRPKRRSDEVEPIHHLEEPDDQLLMRVNLLGLFVALLVAGFAYFLWSHPNYVPACAPGPHRAHCSSARPPPPAPPLGSPPARG
jgi:hypothetical protein